MFGEGGVGDEDPPKTVRERGGVRYLGAKPFCYSASLFRTRFLNSSIWVLDKISPLYTTLPFRRKVKSVK